MKSRQISIDLLRISACLAVITIHVSASRQDATGVGSLAWQAFNLYNTLGRFSVPAFLMISGMFLLSPEKALPLRHIAARRIPRMAAVLIAWELFYGMVDFIWRGGPSSKALPVILQAAIQGHYHLWYLRTLLILLLLTPALRHITARKDRRLHRACMSAFLLLCCLRPFLHLLPVSDIVWRMTNIAGYAGYYLLGYFVDAYPPKRGALTAVYILGALGALSAVISEYAVSVLAGWTSGMFYDFISLPVLLMSVGVFVFFKVSVPKIRFSDSVHHAVRTVSDCTFGIYLVHAFVLERLYSFGLTTGVLTAAAAVPVITGIGFGISLAVIAAYRQAKPAITWFILKNNMPVFRRYIGLTARKS